jgi:hypothetical protein
MKRATPGLPHFLRVTQALAFVSGVAAPAAALLGAADCGGSEFTTGSADCDGCSLPGVAVMPEDATSTDDAARPDAPTEGSQDAAKDAPADGRLADTSPPPGDAGGDAVSRDGAADAARTPDAPYDGRVLGVVIMPDAAMDAFFPGVRISPEAGPSDGQSGGGPLAPPDLAA